MFDLRTGPSLTDILQQTDIWSILSRKTAQIAPSTQSSLTIPGDDSTEATIAVGETVYESIDYIGDRDWYQLELAADQTVLVRMNGLDHDTTNGYNPIDLAELTIYDSAGNVVADSAGTTFEASTIFTAATAGTYFVEAAGLDDAFTGEYQLRVNRYDPVEDHIPADETTTETLDLNAQLSETLEFAGDRDWFRMEVDAFEWLDLSVIGVDHDYYNGISWLTDPVMRLYDADGTLLVENSDLFEVASVTHLTTYAGTYYVEIGAGGDAQAGDYRVERAAGKAGMLEGTIEVGEIVLDTLNARNTTEYYAIELEASDNIRISLTGYDFDTTNTPGALADPLLAIYDADGMRLAINDDRPYGVNGNSALSFTAEETGTYYIAADTTIAGKAGKGDYLLYVWDVDDWRANGQQDDAFLLADTPLV